MRTTKSQSLHDSMTKAQADHWASKGLPVRADLPGYSQPPLVGGHIPDVYIAASFARVILETETGESISTDHTYSQFRAFSSHPGFEFHVLVPESALQQAKAYVSQWGIRVDHWWYTPGV